MKKLWTLYDMYNFKLYFLSKIVQFFLVKLDDKILNSSELWDTKPVWKQSIFMHFFHAVLNIFKYLFKYALYKLLGFSQSWKTVSEPEKSNLF